MERAYISAEKAEEIPKKAMSEQDEANQVSQNIVGGQSTSQAGEAATKLADTTSAIQKPQAGEELKSVKLKTNLARQLNFKTGKK